MANYNRDGSTQKHKSKCDHEPEARKTERSTEARWGSPTHWGRKPHSTIAATARLHSPLDNQSAQRLCFELTLWGKAQTPEASKNCDRASMIVCNREQRDDCFSCTHSVGVLSVYSKQNLRAGQATCAAMVAAVAMYASLAWILM